MIVPLIMLCLSAWMIFDMIRSGKEHRELMKELDDEIEKNKKILSELEQNERLTLFGYCPTHRRSKLKRIK